LYDRAVATASIEILGWRQAITTSASSSALYRRRWRRHIAVLATGPLLQTSVRIVLSPK
jgi:hypothetical protein